MTVWSTGRRLCRAVWVLLGVVATVLLLPVSAWAATYSVPAGSCPASTGLPGYHYFSATPHTMTAADVSGWATSYPAPPPDGTTVGYEEDYFVLEPGSTITDACNIGSTTRAWVLHTTTGTGAHNAPGSYAPVVGSLVWLFSTPNEPQTPDPSVYPPDGSAPSPTPSPSPSPSPVVTPSPSPSPVVSLSPSAVPASSPPSSPGPSVSPSASGSCDASVGLYASPGPGPSPAGSSTPTPSPSASPAPTSSPPGARCVLLMVSSPETGSWGQAVIWLLSSLTLLGVASFVLRGSRRVSRIGT